MSTLDDSREPPDKVPRPPVPATPTTACPEARVCVKSVVPAFSKPCWSAKLASANCPRAAVLPLVNDHVTMPSAPIVKLVNVPLLLPSCWVEEVLSGAAT